jgi:penicillin amidase
LADIAARELPLKEAFSIRWSYSQVPFIEAENDRDLAVALGAVHAHLRLAQIEFMRRIAYGRLAEIFGPIAFEIDHALRVLNVGRAVPEIERRLPEETHTWLSGFAEGINAYVRQSPELPYELTLLNVDPEPWTVADLLWLGRLASTDFTWKVWMRLRRLRHRADWAELWQRLTGSSALPVPGFTGAGGNSATLDWLLGAFDRGGSNSVAVAPRRSASGSSLIASDPHLSIMLPSLWLIAGLRSPGHHAVGLMIPGVPVVALGRNPWIAWGGTSLHAASSELFDVGELSNGALAERRERMRVRWSGEREVIVRETRYGPIITDATLLAGEPPANPLALHWIGHTASDEITALLKINRAKSWEEFRGALEGFAIPAQNMVYADAAGHIGHATAAKLPRRPPTSPRDMVAKTSAFSHWDQFVTAQDLPTHLDPPDGFVASANNAPATSTVTVGFFFSPPERIQRLRQILASNSSTSIANLHQLQSDVEVTSARAMRDSILRAVESSQGLGRSPVALVEALRGWDGAYGVESRGALAFELLAYHLVGQLHGTDDLDVYAAAWDPWALLREDLALYDCPRLARAARAAAGRAAREFARLGTWGSAHRLRLFHAFARAPLFGRRFQYADLPSPGSNETVMKAAFGFAGGRHHVRLGSNARHISDLSDPDENYFVLLGGQDGWMGSTTFFDQLDLWRRSNAIRVPLRSETAAREFPHLTVLKPPSSNSRAPSRSRKSARVVFAEARR